jgi:ABC-type polysaccharide/polyol phosphate export permease
MADYFKRVWDCRHFWVSLVRMDLRTRYRRSVLGLGWSLLHPVAMASILCLVFHQLFDQSITEFGPYLLAGLACWNYITAATLGGSMSFFQNESYIRQCPLPMLIYPLRNVLGASFHFLVTLGVVLAFVACLRGLSWGVVLVHLGPAVLLLFLFGLALATLAALANVYFQDTQHLLEIVFQMFFYATPILYPASKVRERGLGWLVDFNPMAAVLDLVRKPILEGTGAGLASYGVALGLVGALGALAVWAMSRLQGRLIFRL